jgi:hypothetical protein
MKKYLHLARHWVWVAPIVLGVAFALGGAYMVFEGQKARDEVRENIVRESIIVSADADEFAGQLVDSADEAQAQSDVILKHTLAETGGYLYAEIGRFLLPEGNYMLPKGVYLAKDGGTTTDVTAAATDASGKPVNVTTDENLAARNRQGEPIRGWTNDPALAAKDASGAPVPNPIRNIAKDSAFLRTSLGVAVMGFKVSELVIGLGAFLVIMGLVNVFIISPVTYWAAVVAEEHTGVRRREVAPQVAEGRQS